MEEKTKSILEDLDKAALKLKEALALPKNEINRDASIQRFEFTFELTWKLMQKLLGEESIEAYGPKNAIREAAKLGLIDNPTKWFEFLDARNKVSHTYDEKSADEVYEKAKEFIFYLEKFTNNAKSSK